MDWDGCKKCISFWDIDIDWMPWLMTENVSGVFIFFTLIKFLGDCVGREFSLSCPSSDSYKGCIYLKVSTFI